MEVKCPSCDGKGRTLAKLADGRVVQVAICCCEMAHCALCDGKGKVVLADVLAKMGVGQSEVPAVG